MPPVEFQGEEQYAAPAAAQQSFLMRMAMASGLAKDEQEATRVLLGVAIGAVLLAIIVIVFFLGGGAAPAPQTPDSPTWPQPADGYPS